MKALTPAPQVKMVGLVRDAQGRPKFDLDPLDYPQEIQDALAAQMTPAEQKEFFHANT